MKRLFCALAALVLLTVSAAAHAETYDIENLTLDELYILRDRLDARIEALEAQGTHRAYDSGTYLIGQDIPAGDYVLVEHESAVFASVVIRENASEDSGLVLHHLVSGQAVIRLNEGKWVTFSEAIAYPLNQAEPLPGGVATPGGYLIGTQLPAGRYTVRAEDNAPLSSYSVYDGILGSGAQLIKFEVLHGAAEIELSEGEYIELSGCGLAPS